MPRSGKISKSGKCYNPATAKESDFYTESEMHAMKLDQGTLDSYRSALKVHSEANFEPTVDGFLLRLRWKDRGISLGRAKLLKNAIVWHVERNGGKVTANDKEKMTDYIKTCIKDLVNTGEVVEPGAITSAMLPEFFNALNNYNIWCTGWRMPGFDSNYLYGARRNLAISFELGLRSCQMREVRRKHLTKSNDGVWQLRIEKIHDPTANVKGRRMHESKVAGHPLCHPVLVKRLAELKNPEDLLCPEWKYEEFYNPLIHRIAKMLKWEERHGVKFSGHHCIRRGAIQFVEETEDAHAAADFAAHSEKKSATTARYLRSNQTKAAKKETVAKTKVSVVATVAAKAAAKSEKAKVVKAKKAGTRKAVITRKVTAKKVRASAKKKAAGKKK